MQTRAAAAATATALLLCVLLAAVSVQAFGVERRLASALYGRVALQEEQEQLVAEETGSELTSGAVTAVSEAAAGAENSFSSQSVPFESAAASSPYPSAPSQGSQQPDVPLPAASSSSASASGSHSKRSATDDDGEGINEGRVEDMITKVIQQIGRGQLVVLGNEDNGKKNDIIVGNKNFMHKRDATDEDLASAAAVAALAGNAHSGGPGSKAPATNVAHSKTSVATSQGKKKRHKSVASSSLSMP